MIEVCATFTIFAERNIMHL